MHRANVTFEGRSTIFNIDNLTDHIQGFHVSGRFYEERQLLFHRDLIPMKCTVVDIGANVGNHTLFYAKHTWAQRIYPFEPNPKALAILRENITTNSDFRAEIHTEHMHCGLGRRASRLKLIEPNDNNLGGAQFKAVDDESFDAIDCVRLDDLSLEGPIAFIKIDVEGMEIDVLLGGEGTISTFRQTIAIEISEKNEPLFWDWIRSRKYQAIHAFAEYLHFKSYIIVPAF